MSLSVNYEINLDLIKNNYVAIRIKQYDDKTRTLIIHCTINGQEFQLEEGMKALIQVKKPDGNSVGNDCVINLENNVIVADITKQMSTAPGICYADVSLYNVTTEQVLGTMKFNMVIDTSVLTKEDILSSNEFDSLTNIIFYGEQKIQELIDFTNQAKQEYEQYGTAETQRKQNEQERISNENLRKTSEQERVSAENIRISNEESRIEDEQLRQKDESLRKTAEQGRVSAESIRASNEESRIEDEQLRQKDESLRKTAETGRISAEQGRVAAEQSRVSEFNVMKEEHTQALNVMGQYEVQEDPTQIRFRDAKGNYGQTINLGDGLASKAMVNNGGQIFNGNEYHGESSDYGLEIEKVDGNYYQETTNGYQLFAIESIKEYGGKSGTSKGVTWSMDDEGYITLNGTATTNGNILQINRDLFPDIGVEIGRQYHIKLEYHSGTYSGSKSQIGYGVDSSSSGNLFIYFANANNSAEYTFSRGTLSYHYVYVYSGETFTNYKFRAMIYIEGDGTFEPFTGGEPAPNPNYQLEPKFFKSSNFYTNGGNLFNVSALMDTSVGGASAKINDDESITISGNGSLSTRFVLSGKEKYNIKLKPGNLYLKTDIEIYPTAYVDLYSDETYVTTIRITSGTHASIKINNEVAKSVNNARASIVGESGKAIISGTTKIILYQDGNGAWYSYNASNTPLSLELRALPNGVRDTYENGIVTRRVGKVVFDGSSDENWQYFNLNCNQFYISIEGIKHDNVNPSTLCEYFKPDIIGNRESKKEIIYTTSNGIGINTDITTYVSGWKTWLQSNPITVWYELATPTTEYYSFPIIPSYFNYTNAWHDSDVEANDIQWKAKTYDPLEAQNDFIEEDYIKIIETDDMVSTSSNRGGAELLAMDGAYEQVTTNGYQLFDSSKIATRTENGATITNNGDGSFTISGSGAMSQNLEFGYTIPKNLIKVGKIKLSGLVKTYPYFRVVFKGASGELFKLYRDVSEYEITQEILNSITSISANFYGASGTAIVSDTIKPMLYQDGSGYFEPFTGGKPSPNPDYRQDMKAVEVSGICSHDGKNLFDMNKAEPGTIDINGNFVESANGYKRSDFIPIKEGMKVSRSNAGYIHTFFYNKDKEFVKVLLSSLVNVEAPADSYYFRFVIHTDYLNANIMVNYGENVLPYTPYQGSTIPFPLILRALPNGVKDTYKNGVVTRRIGEIVFNGSSSENWVKDTLVTSNNYIRFTITNYPQNRKYGSNINCNKMFVRTTESHGEYEYINSSSTGTTLYLQILKSRLSSETVDGLKTWLQSNPITLWYELATPATEVIGKPFIETYHPWTNIWTDSPINTYMKIGFKNRFGEFYTKKEIDELLVKLQETLLVSTASILPTSTQAEMLEEDYNNLLNEMEEI